MARFTLRRQPKIKKSFGDNFHKWLLLSIKDYFEKDDIRENQRHPEPMPYPIIEVPNIQPKTDSFFELYIISKTYDVYNLAYKGCAG